MKPAADEFVFFGGHKIDVAQILPFQRKMGGLLIYDSYPPLILYSIAVIKM